MKKGISKNKVQRMRNLVSGNYNAKTKVVSGFTKTIKEYKEGDVWEEKGKTWTIKRGIKRTVNKLDIARKNTTTPLVCPKCSGKMNHPGHKKMYYRWGMCLTCVNQWVNKMTKNGTYDEFMSEFDTKNYNAFINDITQEYEDWLDKRNSQHYITEAGDKEDWSGGQSNEQLAKDFYKSIQESQKRREKNESN